MSIEYVLDMIMKLCEILFFVCVGAFLLSVIESLVVSKWHELKARRAIQKILKQQLQQYEQTLIDALSTPDDSDEI